MAVEEISEKQAADASAALADCQAGMAQAAEQAAADAARKAADSINKLNQKLAKLPEDIIEKLQEAIKTLMKVINGWEDPSAPEFDPNKLIDKLQALLDPVVNTLLGIIDSIGLPKIPGLAEISDLLAALKAMKPMEKPEGWEGPWPKPGKKPEIPQELKRVLEELLIALQSLAITLPMVGVNILFNSVDLILGAEIPVVGMSLYTIIGMVPYIREIPQLVSLAPKIVELVTNMGGLVKGAAEGKIKQMIKQAQDMSIPEPPEDVPEPKVLPACPKRES